MERDARIHEYLHGYEGGCPLEEKKILGSSLKKADGKAILWQDLKERLNGKVRVLCA